MIIGYNPSMPAWFWLVQAKDVRSAGLCMCLMADRRCIYPEDAMETPSKTFIPKYFSVTYIWIFTCLGGCLFLAVFSIFRSAPLYDEWEFKGILGSMLFGLTAFYEYSKLVKAIEFNDNAMVVHFRMQMRKIIEYRNVMRVNIQWGYIDSKGAKVHFDGMENQDELLKKMADTVYNRDVLNIYREEEKRTSATRNKRLRYTLIFTVTIGFVAEFVGNADWSYFYIILALYFVLVYQVLRLFIK